MKNKRGQFYLLAAIIIIVVILAFALSTNFLQNKEEVKLYDLGEELGIESQSVLDYGTFNQAPETIADFTELYYKYTGEGKELYFVYGNEETITVASFQDVLTGSIKIDFGSGETSYAIEDSKLKLEEKPRTEKIIITTSDDKQYEINLKSGENFYFIIAQDLGGEQHVVTS